MLKKWWSSSLKRSELLKCCSEPQETRSKHLNSTPSATTFRTRWWSSKQVTVTSSEDLLLVNGTVQIVNSVSTAAENPLCSNSTTTTSFHLKQQKLGTQFWIRKIMAQYLEEGLIFLFLIAQTSIIQVRILVIVIRMLHTFMRMLIHAIDFQEVNILKSRIMKSGKSLLNDPIPFLIQFLSWSNSFLDPIPFLIQFLSLFHFIFYFFKFVKSYFKF